MTRSAYLINKCDEMKWSPSPGQIGNKWHLSKT